MDLLPNRFIEFFGDKIEQSNETCFLKPFQNLPTEIIRNILKWRIFEKQKLI